MSFWEFWVISVCHSWRIRCSLLYTLCHDVRTARMPTPFSVSIRESRAILCWYASFAMVFTLPECRRPSLLVLTPPFATLLQPTPIVHPIVIKIVFAWLANTPLMLLLPGFLRWETTSSSSVSRTDLTRSAKETLSLQRSPSRPTCPFRTLASLFPRLHHLTTQVLESSALLKSPKFAIRQPQQTNLHNSSRPVLTQSRRLGTKTLSRSSGIRPLCRTKSTALV